MGVGVGTGVVGKKNSKSKLKLKIKKENGCKIHEKKISAYMQVLFPFPAVSKANKLIF